MTKRRQIRFTLIRTLMAIGIALLFAALLIFISSSGSNFAEKLRATKEALKQMLIGPLFRMSAKKGTSFEAKRFTEILAAMIPTTFTGLSVCIMFAANQFNMGAEGGIMLGAFVSAMAAIYLPLPAGVHPVVAVLLGGIAVGIVMLIPAVLKAKLNVSEMVCSLMLNYIIMYVIKFLMNTYLADKSKGQIMSFPFRETSVISPIVDNKIFSGSKLTWGFVIAMVAVILCGLFMYRSRWGYAIRMIGINQDFSKYSGMNVAGTIILSQVAGGFLAGAGGGIEMLGRYNAFSWSALPGYGWTGITIAILAGNNPYMVPLAAFFMAYLSKGCDLMATYAKVPAQLISIVQGVIFLFFAADQFLSGYKQKLVVQSAQEEIARQNAMKAQEG
ncbi:MAG: ABC transporter permease [Anaerolineaceae bacterium]|nr:ABC transporter permease [Anaerolineaceae bacterium]